MTCSFWLYFSTLRGPQREANASREDRTARSTTSARAATLPTARNHRQAAQFPLQAFTQTLGLDPASPWPELDETDKT
jgi:hypothetical protein